MLNRHKLTPKISFLAILLAMMASMAIGAGGASGKNTPNPSLDDVQKPATATPFIDSKVNALESTLRKSQPMECSVTRNRAIGIASDHLLSEPEIRPVATSLPTVCSSSLLSMFATQSRGDVCSESSIRLSVSYIDDDYYSTYRNRRHQNEAGLVTCTVGTTANSGTGSLRECLEAVAQNGSISFDPNVFAPTNPATIAVSSSLPPIIRDGITIDGTGAGVILDGNHSTPHGLVIAGAKNVTIKGLQIINFSLDGVVIQSDAVVTAENNVIGGPEKEARNIISGNRRAGILIISASRNLVQGNYIGTNASGLEELGQQQIGIFLTSSIDDSIDFPTRDNLITDNVISGNTEMGIGMQDPDTTGNKVLGNFIGTTADGTQALGNDCVGVAIIAQANQNLIGDGTEEGRNVISGNRQAGVDIRHPNTKQNQVLGNYIGTNWMGTSAISNKWGVVMLCEAEENQVGNGSAEGRNIISGNSESGVQLQNEVANNSVQGNYIGTDKNGTSTLPNRWGVTMARGANHNLIGGTTEGQGNIISGNEESGIEILNDLLLLLSQTSDNQIQGNSIGTAANGMPLGNGFAGVCLFLGASSNTIGPANTIAHNADAGVRIQDDLILIPPVGNRITQNVIHQNDGLPIDFIDPPIPLNPPPAPPTLSNWLGDVVSGTACDNCQIELFGNPDSTPAGTQFLVAESADGSGNFTITLPSDAPTDLSCLSATATDQAGTTSEFSDSLCQTPGSTMTPTATNTPSATPTATNTPSATPTATNTPSATPTISNDPPKVTSTATPVTATPTATQTPSSNQLYLPLVLR